MITQFTDGDRLPSKTPPLNEEIPDATPESMGLCGLIERYKTTYSEIEPKPGFHIKKPWYAPLDEKGQVADLREILALSGE